jgi:hypothetical protein
MSLFYVRSSKPKERYHRYQLDEKTKGLQLLVSWQIYTKRMSISEIT